MTITLTGDNAYKLGAELRKLQSEYLSKHGELSVEQIDCSDVELNTLAESLVSVSLISDSKLVVLKSLSLNKPASEFIEKYLDDKTSDADLVIVEPKIDKRSTLYKSLKAKTDFREFITGKQPDLATWLVSEAKEQGGDISRTDATYLVGRVGANQLRLKQEIDKLITYNPKISTSSIDELCEPSNESTIFGLIDAAFNGQHRRLLNLYKDQRALKVEPVIIVAMLTWQLNCFALIKLAKDKPVPTIAEETKLNPYTIRNAQPILRKLSLGDLKRYIDDLCQLDLKMKTKKISIDDALKSYLMGLAL